MYIANEKHGESLADLTPEQHAMALQQRLHHAKDIYARWAARSFYETFVVRVSQKYTFAAAEANVENVDWMREMFAARYLVDHEFVDYSCRMVLEMYAAVVQAMLDRSKAKVKQA